MNNFLFVVLLILAIQETVFGSALIQRDIKARQINVISHFYLTGPGTKLNYASTLASQIARAWNAANGVASVEGIAYRVNFVITQSVIENGNQFERLIDETALQGQYQNNFVWLEILGPGESRASYFSLCRNTGTWFLYDEFMRNATAQHEYGHGLCLDHPEEIDITGRHTPPHIMYSVATFVADEYASSPDQKIPRFFGNIDPSKRIVTQENIDLLGLDKLVFDENGFSGIGSL